MSELNGMGAAGEDFAQGAETASVSVIVPCRNERDFIDAFCDAVLAQQLPPGVRMDVWIADGMSDDGTRERLAQRMAADARVHMIDNPARVVSAGLNACLAQARGEVIVRMDVHTVYATDYIAECLAALKRTGADNVGGPWQAQGVDAMQRAVAAAFQSRWVAGGARSRQLDYEGPADTVYLGCWPRQTFERFGGFDEILVRNQDDEHNLRITLGGGRIWQSARIRSTYAPRGRWAQVFKQYMQYGYWKPFVMRKHGQPAALRHAVPGVFVAALGLFGIGGWLGWGWAAHTFWALAWAYAAYLTLVSVSIARTAGWSQLGRIAAVIVAYHGGYGWGSICGAWDVYFRGAPRRRFGVMTR